MLSNVFDFFKEIEIGMVSKLPLTLLLTFFQLKKKIDPSFKKLPQCSSFNGIFIHPEELSGLCVHHTILVHVIREAILF